MGSSWYKCSWVVHLFMGSSCGSTHKMLKFKGFTHANAMNFYGIHHGQFIGIPCLCCY